MIGRPRRLVNGKMNVEYDRAERARRRRLGLCSDCTTPAIPGKRRCVKHMSYVRRFQYQDKHVQAHKDFVKRQYQQRIEDGRCVRCGLFITTMDPAARVSCRKCLKYQSEASRAYTARIREERRQNGLCLRCGKVKPKTGYVNCGSCRDRAAENGRRAYAEKLEAPQ